MLERRALLRGLGAIPFANGPFPPNRQPAVTEAAALTADERLVAMRRESVALTVFANDRATNGAQAEAAIEAEFGLMTEAAALRAITATGALACAEWALAGFAEDYVDDLSPVEQNILLLFDSVIGVLRVLAAGEGTL